MLTCFSRSSFLVITSWAGVDGQQRMWLQEELQLFDARAGAPVQGGGEHHHGWVRLLQHVRQTTGRPVQPQGQVRRTQRSQMRDDSRRRSQRNLQRYNCNSECFVWTPHTRLCTIFLSFCLLLIFWTTWIQAYNDIISYSMRRCDCDAKHTLPRFLKLDEVVPKLRVACDFLLKCRGITLKTRYDFYATSAKQCICIQESRPHEDLWYRNTIIHSYITYHNLAIKLSQ